ncbi:hypothetical protein ACLB2K_038279 [Fragaria x ananassa]
MSDICQLVHIDTKGAQFTWARRRGVRGNVELRLDRCLENLDWLDAWAQFDCFTLPGLSSDHNPLIMSFSKDFGARHSLFRFWKMWVEHTDFNDFVKQCWGSVVTYGCPLSVLQHKLRVLRKALRVWNWEVFGNIHKKVDDDLTALVQIQHDIATSGGSDDLLAKESVLQTSLTESLRIWEMFCQEKSRQGWLAEGDRNTSYFHAMCRVRKAQSSITLLREGMSRVIHSLVTEEENNRLIEVPSSDEIWSAIKSMDPDSAPGPDGFNGHFFVSCWDIVGRDVVATVQYFFRTGKLPSSFNSSITILIPKVEHADCIKNFRPIALANFIFKIIPKIISLRSTDIASRIISAQQHAFVKGRSISDCIMTTLECFNLLDNTCYRGNVAIKVDITKAFDTLSWDFLAPVLQAFGFHHVFVTWLHPISSPRGTCAPSHALFADDIIVFCRGDRRSLAVIMDFLGEYGVNSGQVINKAKSQVFISKHLSYRHHLIVDLLGIPEGTTPFTYLGVPIFRGSMDKRGVPLVAWKTCCAPMDEGGLGLKQLFVLNRSLLLKRAWEIYSSTSEGCSFLRNRFWRNGALQRSYASSSIWPDNFIGRPLNAYFGANVNIMKNTVSDFIHDGNWNLPPLLQLHFPNICEIISRVPIAFDSHDRLIWMPSTFGILTARDAYSFLRIHLPPLAWSKVIWSKFITPRMSMLAWKVLKGRVISDDFLQTRGVSLASCCVLCRQQSESIDHIFLFCPFASTIWHYMTSNFGISGSPNSVLLMLNLGLSSSRSTQLRELWSTCIVTTLWFIWSSRHKIKYEGLRVDATRVCSLISRHVISSSKLVTGCMFNSSEKLVVLKKIGVQCRPRCASRVIEVNWHPPLHGCIKLNIDEAWKSSSNKAGYGGVFRDYSGKVMGAFCSNLDIPSSVAAEVMTVIKAIELARVREWKHIWLEVDPELILSFLRSPTLVPWQLSVEWSNCLYQISQMNFHSSHIF